MISNKPTAVPPSYVTPRVFYRSEQLRPWANIADAPLCYNRSLKNKQSQPTYQYVLGCATVKSKTRRRLKALRICLFAAKIKLFHPPMKSWRQARHIIPAPIDYRLAAFIRKRKRLENGTLLLLFTVETRESFESVRCSLSHWWKSPKLCTFAFVWELPHLMQMR